MLQILALHQGSRLRTVHGFEKNHAQSREDGLCPGTWLQILSAGCEGTNRPSLMASTYLWASREVCSRRAEQRPARRCLYDQLIYLDGLWCIWVKVAYSTPMFRSLWDAGLTRSWTQVSISWTIYHWGMEKPYLLYVWRAQQAPMTLVLLLCSALTPR